jgi:trk system potassium uptake protein TrkH
MTIKTKNNSNLRAAFYLISMMIMLEAAFMLISTGVALVLKSKGVGVLFESAAITFAAGLILRIITKTRDVVINRKNGFISVALIWLVMSGFGCLPFVLGEYIPSVTDALFETMSGFTTTGASILDNIETLPSGILFWRSLIQWIGGIGIVVVVVSFMQIEGGGGMALISAEMVGPEKGKITPSTRKTGKILIFIYSALTFATALAYWAGGMNLYEAVCHSFASVSSGGFSTRDASAAAFSPMIQYLMIVFMIPSGTNFILMYYIFKGKWSKVRHNDEFKVYIGILIIFSIIVAAFIYEPSRGIEITLREATFQVVSIMTTTGFTTANYGFWAAPAVLLLFVLMFVGGMGGSTSGGIKVGRAIVLFKNSKNIVKYRLHNRAFIPIKIDKRPISYTLLYNVMAVVLLYIAVFVVAVLCLTFVGLQFEEALEGTLSCLSCVGPVYVQRLDLTTFSSFPDVAKWIFTFLMYLGRLEILTIFAIFMPSFWRK